MQEKAAGFSTLHPRCGTGFLLIVMVLSVFLFAFIGKPTLPWLVLSRLIGIPIIIGIAYEIGIKGLGEHQRLAGSHLAVARTAVAATHDAGAHPRPARGRRRRARGGCGHGPSRSNRPAVTVPAVVSA